MNPYAVIEKFGKSLRRDYQIVVRPDHPRMFAPPDILLGGNGTLVAIFSPHANERGEAEALQARLIAAKLLLPSHTRYVLVENPKRPLTNRVLANFDEIFLEHQSRKIVRF